MSLLPWLPGCLPYLFIGRLDPKYILLIRSPLLPRSMLAVMTMNIGYFVSILGGTFLGSLAVGRYSVLSEH